MTRRGHLGLLTQSAAIGFASTWGSPLRAAEESDGVAEFMEKFAVPGLSVAIAKGGKIVRREAFGFADLEKKKELHAAHRFRIASVSKPITAVAVMLLVERGRLKLDDLVFGEDGVLAVPGPDGINVRHLLTHTSGAWKNDSSDPMFRKIELGHAELIAWAVKTLPPEHAPGEKYAYSNFGYCLLGRIIEKVSGQTYEEFMRGNVLEPCGAGAMQIGGNTLVERLEREVFYYMGGKRSAFEMNVRRMDAHGGWVGTPSELVEFALRVDGFAEPADLLKKESIATMTERGGANEDYACGWMVNKVGNWWHGGSLPGLTSLLVRTSDGHCWAACANTRADGISLALDRLMWKIVMGMG